MSLFGAIGISGTGLDAMQTWIDADAGNIANANDAVSPNQSAYEAQVATFSPLDETTGGVGTGVAVAVDTSGDPGEVAEDPQSPVANGAGEVRVPDISLGDQLVGLVQAQEGYQGDTSAMSRAITAYQAALQIGN